jgi:hypothetical protein
MTNVKIRTIQKILNKIMNVDAFNTTVKTKWKTKSQFIPVKLMPFFFVVANENSS